MEPMKSSWEPGIPGPDGNKLVTRQTWKPDGNQLGQKWELKKDISAHARNHAFDQVLEEK